ncbi:Uncharacterized protein TPAR_03671 [Tolypocladium paradoxum]|uniref:Uncharacterized protein n=1 Tax=Tolypocladium paradoxum TaxID=94208 RepID=A0A2S4L120_9HYPO|nr:Uncharacterized protein TPAR_03671 [Tolypocladium paradoxum]
MRTTSTVHEKSAEQGNKRRLWFLTSRPRAHEAHAKRAQEDEDARHDAPPPAQVAPALVAEEVLGQQLDERGKRQQARRDGVHDADDDEPDLRVRAVERVRREPDGLADGRGAAVGERHGPRLPAPAVPVDGGDARAQRQALKGLVEDDGDEQHDEVGADGHAERHADEDAVEEDARLEQDALEALLAALHLGRQPALVDGLGGAVLAVGVRLGLLRPVVGGFAVGYGNVVEGAAPVAPVQLRQALAHARRPAAQGPHVPEGQHGGAGAHVALGRVPVRARLAAAPGRARQQRRRRHMARRVKDHLDDGDEEDGGQGDGPRHGLVVLGPEVAEARVAQRDKGRGQEVHKGRGDEHARAEVAHGEEEAARDAQAGDPGGHDGERAAERRHDPDDEEGAGVQRHVVLVGVDAARLARRLPLGHGRAGEMRGLGRRPNSGGGGRVPTGRGREGGEQARREENGCDPGSPAAEALRAGHPAQAGVAITTSGRLERRGQSCLAVRRPSTTSNGRRTSKPSSRLRRRSRQPRATRLPPRLVVGRGGPGAKHSPAVEGVLARGDELAQVGDAVEVLARRLGGRERGRALVPGEVLEGALVGLVEADHWCTCRLLLSVGACV